MEFTGTNAADVVKKIKDEQAKHPGYNFAEPSYNWKNRRSC